MRRDNLTPGRALLIWTLLLLATLLTLGATLSIWIERQLLDTGAWTRASGELLADGEVRGVVSREVVGFLELRGAEIEARLGVDLDLDQVDAGTVDSFLASEQAVVLFREANGQVHAQLVSALEGDGAGPVVLDLGPLATSLGRQLGLPEEAGQIEGRIVLLQSSELAEARRPVRMATRVSGVWIALLAAVLFALALALARGRRRFVFTAIGACLALAGLVLLASRSLIGDAVLDSYVVEAAYRPAIRSAWFVETTLLREAAVLLIAGGAAAVAIGLLGTAVASARRR